MYYDLIASLPHLPHFERATQLPITRLRLDQRLRLLKPAHASQLAASRWLVGWRFDRAYGKADAAFFNEYAALMATASEPALREYAAFRMDQQTLLAALRRKQAGLGLPEGHAWRLSPCARHIRTRWDEPDFRLALLHPWLPQTRELLAAGDARGLERLLMDVAWRRLDRCAEQRMFGFEAVFSYVFKWDILRAWLASDADAGKNCFRNLVDQVTHVEHS